MSAPVEFEGSVHRADLERLVAGDHHDPHQILGPHLQKDGDGRVWVVIRGWRPDAAEAHLTFTDAEAACYAAAARRP